MSERSINVTLKADVATYLDAMNTASQATDKLTSSVKKLRQEIRQLEGESVPHDNFIDVTIPRGTLIR